jgi:alpha-tubulin suppressor-like RCC1 family protein
MPLTKLQAGSFETGAIDTSDLSSNATIAFSSTSAFANALAPKITTVNVANSAFSVLDDTAVNVGGGYIVITGANFQSGASVLIDTTPASAVTFVNTSTLQVQIPAKAAASYNLYVVNPDGGTGIKVAGLNYSAEPSWVTSSPLSNQSSNTAFNVTLSATGATSYAVAAGSTLPAGTTLAANGYFSGTVSIGAETTYSFSVVATDAELQDSSKTFQVTVTVIPATRLWLWGSGSYGKLGQNNETSYSSPVQVGTGTTWNNIGAANHDRDSTHTLATKTDGTLWAWGAGQYGRLGLNDQVNRSSPIQVGTGTNWNRVAVGPLHSLATKTDGTLWSWGVTNDGRLGDGIGSGSYKSSPVQVGSGTTWNLILASEKNGLATKTDGTLWAWGLGSSGQIGNFSTNTQTTPQLINGGVWSSIALGAAHCLAVRSTDNTLWSWGYNGEGQGGRNNLTNVSNLSQVSGTTWSKVAAAQSHSFAIKTDGTLWAWGMNAYGQLGLNDTVYKSSPVQVGTGTNWSEISTGQTHAIAIKTDGSLWSWGSGSNGKRGLSSGISSSSPVQVGTNTNWSKIVGGHSHTIAITSN